MTKTAHARADAIENTAIELVHEITAVGDMPGQIARLIEMGRAFAGLPDVDKNEATRIHGCQSQLWLTGERQGEVMIFRADSDSLIMRGLLTIIMALYDRKRPADILRYIGSADDDLILTLAPSRASGFRLLKRRVRETTEGAL